jgi:LPS-assembly lipoprotein
MVDESSAGAGKTGAAGFAGAILPRGMAGTMGISGRAAFRWIAILAVLGGAPACGFEPLYGRKDNGSVVDDLAAVRIDLIPDRSGQILRNYLLDDLNPRGQAAQAAYTLSIRITEPRQEVGLQRNDTVTRYAYGVSATYSLRDARGVSVISGSSASGTSFEISDSEFATLSNQSSARDRLMQQISSDIREQLAVYFNNRRAAQ